VPYTLVDLAEDVKGLLDHLEVERTHVVGASMGGMIAQVLAGSHPDRVLSLGVIMSSTGKAFSALPRFRVIKLAFGAPAKDAPWEDRLAFEVRNISIINGPNFLRPLTNCADGSRSCGHAATTRRACCASSTPSWAPAT
jgi:pimeloyl-ACP methyl ester carboxylesterase